MRIIIVYDDKIYPSFQIEKIKNLKKQIHFNGVFHK